MGASDPISLTLEWEGVDGSPLPPDAKIVDDGLEQFNQSVADFTTSLKFACIARLRSGTVVGGALARWWGECCELQQIRVDEYHRTGGIGRRLVQMVEEEARTRGCSLVYLDTFHLPGASFLSEARVRGRVRVQRIPEQRLEVHHAQESSLTAGVPCGEVFDRRSLDEVHRPDIQYSGFRRL